MKRNILLIAICFLAGFFGCKVAERTGAGPTEKAMAAKEGKAPETLRAQTIQLVDAEGRVTATLESFGDEGAALKLLDRDGNPRVILGNDADGAALGFFDENQNHQLDLMHLPDGPSMVMIGNDGNAFVAAPEQMGFADTDGSELWVAP